MLSTIARAAIRRVGAGAIHPSTNRVFQSIWHLQSLRTYDNADGTLPSTDASFILRRSLATVAKVPATSSKPKAKKAPKKNATKKLKKKVASKPKSAIGRPKKVLTKEEETKLRIRSLKKVALSVPKMKPSRPWLVFIVEYIAENHTGQQQSLGLLSKAASAKFKSLSPSEVETYNRKSNLNKTENETTFKEWIESYTPAQINDANNARSLLKKLTGKPFGPQLRDDRLPKRVRSSMALFVQDRWATGEMKGIKTTDALKLLSKEFQDLPESEKQAYGERAVADKARYLREYKAAFNRDPPSQRVKTT